VPVQLAATLSVPDLLAGMCCGLSGIGGMGDVDSAAKLSCVAQLGGGWHGWPLASLALPPAAQAAQQKAAAGAKPRPAEAAAPAPRPSKRVRPCCCWHSMCRRGPRAVGSMCLR